jgi:hypothetical protein
VDVESQSIESCEEVCRLLLGQRKLSSIIGGIILSLHSLVVIAPFVAGTPNTNVGRLSEDLEKLAKGFGGLHDLSYRSSTTFFRLRFSGLASEYDSLRGKVEALEKRYPDTAFSLIESMSTN